MHIDALRPLAEAGKLGCMLYVGYRRPYETIPAESRQSQERREIVPNLVKILLVKYPFGANMYYHSQKDIEIS
jgi:hypothetical protein